MSWFWSKSKEEPAQPEGWNVLETLEQLDAVFLASNSRPSCFLSTAPVARCRRMPGRI